MFSFTVGDISPTCVQYTRAALNALKELVDEARVKPTARWPGKNNPVDQLRNFALFTGQSTMVESEEQDQAADPAAKYARICCALFFEEEHVAAEKLEEYLANRRMPSAPPIVACWGARVVPTDGSGHLDTLQFKLHPDLKNLLGRGDFTGALQWLSNYLPEQLEVRLFNSGAAMQDFDEGYCWKSVALGDIWRSVKEDNSWNCTDFHIPLEVAEPPARIRERCCGEPKVCVHACPMLNSQ